MSLFVTRYKSTWLKDSASSAGQKRDEAYSLAIASDDELFHYYLYDWHVSRNLQEQLLEVSSARQ